MKGRPLTLLIALVGMTAWSAVAAESQGKLIDAYRLLQQGNDLSAVEWLRKLASSKENRSVGEAALSALHQYGPRLNGLVVAPSAPQGTPATAQDLTAAKDAMRRDAVETIAAMARDRQVVILNEAHDDPEHRAFALAVIKALRPLGFSRLAVEAFNNDEDAALTDMAGLGRGYPVRSTGGYVGDPVFGDLIRQSLALGYRPVAYEQTFAQREREGGDPIDAREEAQASNLAKAMALSPGARFVVFAGYRHAAKSAISHQGSPHRWMAARLWKMTGSEPLSIDQTGLGSTAMDRAGQMLRDEVRRSLNQPVVLFSGQKPLIFGEWRGNVDLQVVHPKTVVINGRPTWLSTMGRRPRQPPLSFVPTRGRALVQAFIASEGADAIPVDEVVLRQGGRTVFMVPDTPLRFLLKETLR